MNVLFIGDIVGSPGRQAVVRLLPEIKKEYAIDFVVANAENAAGGAGITPSIAKELFSCGCDVLTSGDHIWDRREIVDFLQTEERLLRPANLVEGTPGRGHCIVTLSQGAQIAVVDLQGRVFMRSVECPFRAAALLIETLRQTTPNIIIDMHAEATSEKVAMGHFLDGKVSAVIGTHTHIQTADEHILPQGTAYLTDVGMTGPYDSVIGQQKDRIIQRFLSSMPVRFDVATGDVELWAAVIDIDTTTGKATAIQRIRKKLV